MRRNMAIIAGLVLLVWGWQRWGAGPALGGQSPGEEVAVEGTGPSSVFLAPVKPQLERELAEIMTAISLEHPLAEAEAQQVAEYVFAYNLRYDEGNEVIMNFVRSLGIGAIPAIASKALDADPENRLRALLTLEYLVRPREHIDEDYAETEGALVVCFLRSLHDVDPLIRRACLGLLEGIARARWPDPPPETVCALVVSGVRDPDELVRLTALHALKQFGLPIQHPKIPEKGFR